jgi:hypothetical protein
VAKVVGEGGGVAELQSQALVGDGGGEGHPQPEQLSVRPLTEQQKSRNPRMPGNSRNRSSPVAFRRIAGTW